MDNQKISSDLTTYLKLERPPVALAFVASRPTGIPDLPGEVPSACTFWRLAETELFYAEAADHFECPVGAITMGFDLPPERAPQAEQLVGTMIELGYFGADEAAHFPSVKKPHGGIVYGPLARFPLPPEAVILQVAPYQAMLLAEANGSVALREAPGLAAMGRPACSALARAVEAAASTLSLGCIGARTYVELADDRAILILPAAALERTAERLPALVQANEVLATHHAGQKARFERDG